MPSHRPTLAGALLAAAVGGLAIASPALAQPNLSVSGPKDGAHITDSALLKCSASSRYGMEYVRFYLDGKLVDRDRASNCQWRFSAGGLTDGAHVVDVVATDRRDETASVRRTYTVGEEAQEEPEAPVSLTLSGPADGANLDQDTWLKCEASSSAGIDRVRFYLDGKLVDTDRPSKCYYTFPASKLSKGSHVLEVVATDERGATGSLTRTYTVGGSAPPADNSGPVISYDGISAGDALGAATSIVVSASDPAGVQWVRFYVDGTLVETDTSDYGIVLDPAGLTAGSHVLRIRALDGAGNDRQIDVPFTVPAVDGQGPSLSLDGPASGATISSATSLAVQADDVSGVAEVRFYLDGTLVDTDTGPYAWTFDPQAVGTGSHTVRIVGEDELGNQSAIERTYVVPSPEPPPPPSSGGGSTGGGSTGGGGEIDANHHLYWQSVDDLGPISRDETSPWEGYQIAASDRLTAVSTPLRGGAAPYSAKFTVKPGDTPAGSGNRTELWLGGHNRPTASLGEDSYNAFSVYIPSDFRAGKWTIFHQMHGATGSPPVAFQSENKSGADRLVVMMRGGSSSSPSSTAIRIADSVRKSAWHDFVYRVRWYPDSRGVLQVWHRVNGGAWEQVVNRTGAVGYTSSGDYMGAYPKLGVYRSSTIDWDTTVYHGGMVLEAPSFNEAAKVFGS